MEGAWHPHAVCPSPWEGRRPGWPQANPALRGHGPTLGWCLSVLRSCDWCFLIFSLLLRCFLGWDTGPGPPWPSRTIHRVPVGFRHELANHSAAASTGPCHCLSLSVLECSVCLALGPPPMAGHLCATLSCDLTHLPATESTGCGESRRDHQRQARLQCESCLPSLCASCTHGWDTEPRADPPSPGGSHLHN